MLRPINNALILLLTAFSACSCVLWARSGRYADGLEIVAPKGSFLAATHPGAARLCWPSPVFRVTRPNRLRVTASTSPRTASALFHEDAGFGFGFAWGDAALSGTTIHYLQVPFWPVSSAGILWPAAILLARARRRRLCHARGLCRACHYDLRATPHRCPECGTTPAGPRPPGRWCPVLAARAAAVCILLLALCWSARHDFRAAACQPVDFALLAGYNFDEEHGVLTDIPLPIRQLDGQRVCMVGDMIPLDDPDTMTSFALVPNRAAGTRPPPLVRGTIVARLANGRYFTYRPDLIRITGTLHVRVEYEDGFLISIYTITVDQAELTTSPNAANAH